MSVLLDFSKIIGFEWDIWNIEKIKKKHDVDWQEVEEVFQEFYIIASDEKHSRLEKRYSVLGRTKKGRLLTVIFTTRNSKIRVISARTQHKKERLRYQQSL